MPLGERNRCQAILVVLLELEGSALTFGADAETGHQQLRRITRVYQNLDCRPLHWTPVRDNLCTHSRNALGGQELGAFTRDIQGRRDFLHERAECDHGLYH